MTCVITRDTVDYSGIYFLLVMVARQLYLSELGQHSTLQHRQSKLVHTSLGIHRANTRSQLKRLLSMLQAKFLSFPEGECSVGGILAQPSVVSIILSSITFLAIAFLSSLNFLIFSIISRSGTTSSIVIG